MFELVDGIPVHALVVHAVVVLVPLAALGLLLMAFWKRFSRSLGWLVLLAALAALGTSFVAKLSGEALAELTAEPRFDHADYGELLPWFVTGLTVMTLVLWLVDRRTPAEGETGRSGLRIVLAIVAVAVALANLYWIFRVGHSGASSVWNGRVVV